MKNILYVYLSLIKNIHILKKKIMDKSFTNPLNIEKKKSIYGLYQDIYTLIYCAIIIPISIYNLYYETNIIDWKIDLFSYIYFIITGIINLYYLEYNFILHHLVCIGLIWIGKYNNNLVYYQWLSKCFLAEISNIFLSNKNILKTLRNSNVIQTKMYENINDVLFVVTYFGIRMFYLVPYTFIYLYQNYNSKLKFNYFEFILINVILMVILNLYWSNLIFKKILKIKKN